MTRKTKIYFIGSFFITILLFKSIASFAPLFSGDLEDNLLTTELMAENESEKKGSSKAIESTPSEEFFEHPIQHTHLFSVIAFSKKHTEPVEISLQNVCLDIPTPPPNKNC